MLPGESKKAIETSGVFTFGIPEVAISGVGHYSPNYKTFLEKGFFGVKKEAKKHLAELGIPKDGREIEKYHFWNAIVMVCDAFADFAGIGFSILLWLLMKPLLYRRSDNY
jgi:formate C-acetyltransferase